MLKKDELYTSENKLKMLLIFTLFFIILVIGYLIYSNFKNNGTIIKGTRVLGVTYIPVEKSKKEESTEDSIVQYNTKSNMSNIDDKDEYEDIVLVDDKDKYTKIVTVKNSI